MKKTSQITKEDLERLYIINNLTVQEIASQLSFGTASICRKLKEYNIKKPEELRRLAISKTKQNKTEEEKKEYSEHISRARKGKGIGQVPWNKGIHTGNGWTGKHHLEETKQKISQTKRNKSKEEKAAIEAKRLSSRVYSSPWNKGIHTGSWTEEQKKCFLEKQYTTKKQNHSFNTSKVEEHYKDYLINKFGENDVIHHYTLDQRYPFECDFYIKSLDLFIELNLTWTHGNHPFNKDATDDLQKLEIWKEKAKTSAYYQNAIYTWTDLDVRKQKIAKENNLNYKVYYTEEEAYND